MDDTIRVLSNDALRSLAFRRQFREWLLRQPESRRDVIELGSDVLNSYIEAGGTITKVNRRMIALPPGIFDDVHGEDGSGVWISEQRRNADPKRRYAARLLPRLRLYWAIAVIGGRPITSERRRADVAEMRNLLRRFNHVWRARYVREVQKTVRAYDSKSPLLYGAAIRRLRLRFKAELDLWEAQQR